MAVSLQPFHPGFLSQPWGTGDEADGVRPEGLDLSNLWISQSPTAGIGTSLGEASMGIPHFPGVDSVSALMGPGRPRALGMQGKCHAISSLSE